MPNALVYWTARNSPKTERIMNPVGAGLKTCGYHVTKRDSWGYPCGDEATFDLLAIWGDYYKTERIYADRAAFPHLLHVDNGYLRRGHYYGYYSLSSEAKQATTYLWKGPCPPARRWRQLHLPIAPWEKAGQDILVLGLSRKQCDTLGLAYPEWNKAMLVRAREASGRPCVYREKQYHNRNVPLVDVLQQGSWYLAVGYHTKGLVEALLAGVPICTLGEAVTQRMGMTSLAHVHTRIFPDNREEFFTRLAWHQWTLEEIQRGLPWRDT